MGRRTVLLIVAVVIAAVGAALVFLYVQGIDNRAEANQEPVEVLAATEKIDVGETIEAAQDAGKLDLVSVPKEDVVPGALTSTESLSGEIAVQTIFPKEQILPGKFGSVGQQQTINIEDDNMAVSVQLDDPGRVAGFVNPGASVAIFITSEGQDATSGFTRLLLPKVEVIGVGDTTVLSRTTTDETGAQTTEQLPKTLMTLSLSQDDAEKIIYASRNSTLSFGLLTDKTKTHPSKGTDGTNLFKLSRS